MDNNKFHNDNQEYVQDIAKELNGLALGAGSAWDDLRSYFTENELDVEYTMDSGGGYLGARIWIGIGGPSVWIDTRDGTVNLAWGTDRASAYIGERTQKIIADIYADDFEYVVNGCR